jgi:hypothetical protein
VATILPEQPHAGLYVTARLTRNGLVRAHVTSRLPGVEPHAKALSAALTDWDESNSLLADFHNEWKAWGMLLDCVVTDWVGASSR